jgi:hypothetical protein
MKQYFKSKLYAMAPYYSIIIILLILTILFFMTI